MSKLASIFFVSAAFVLPSLPALASDNNTEWLSQTFRSEQPERRNQSMDRRATSNKKIARAEQSESDDSKKRSKKSARAERAEQSATSERAERKQSNERKVRVARADNDDNDSRPQRKSSSKPRPTDNLSGRDSQSGMASFYSDPQPVASGGRFNPNAMTAAHKTLPFGTRVRVTRTDNGQSVDVVINDRGPYIGGRIIDLSRRAASELNITNAGVAKVRVAILGRG